MREPSAGDRIPIIATALALSVAALTGMVGVAVADVVAGEAGPVADDDRQAEVSELAATLFEPPTELWRQLAASSADDDPVGRLAKGVLALDAGRPDDARLLLEAACENPAAPYAHYYLARLALERGDPEAALDAIRETIRVRRDFAAAYRLLGHAHLALGADHNAFSAFRTVIALSPGNAFSHLELGRAYLERGRPRHAVVELGRTLELDPALVEARFLLGRAQLNAGCVEEGFGELERYVQEARDIPGEEERVARARLLLRRFAGATD
ncbi:MAG: tetratricopeptide repeat protein [Candidatus Eiseniibacteriota bacterium]|jgi:tetratricopeptide (TPR) repeat protein